MKRSPHCIGSIGCVILGVFTASCDGQPGEVGSAVESQQALADEGTGASAAAPASGTVLYQTAKVTAVQDGDWVRWQFASKLADKPASHVYRGTRGPDGDCGFTGAGSHAALKDDVVSIERAVAVNANQCLLNTESASLPRKDAVDRGLIVEDAQKIGNAKSEAGEEGGSALQLEAGYTFSGSIQTQIEDPVNLDVADARSNIEWNANGTCVTAWHRWPDWYWFGPSGWGLNYSDWPGTDPNSNWCGGVNQTTIGRFSNGIFCFFFDTWVNHNSTQFNAFPDGGASWSWNTSWGGGCSDLLSFSVVVN